MTDDLRTRIASAVWMRHRADAFAQVGLDALAVPERPIPPWAYGMADAVIAELGRRTCQRCRIAVPLDGFPLPHDGSDVMRPFCWSCTNYVEWATS